MLKIASFTMPELECFRKDCNFTNVERTFFDLRAQDFTLEEIAEKMHVSVSTTKRINTRVKNKIIKII